MAVKRKSARARSGNDAVEMLTSDHKKVKALFKEFAALKKQTADSEEKTTLGPQDLRRINGSCSDRRGDFLPRRP